ncbi:hypothetical protein C8034_v003241 [Colletotrichum sidae]|uniref:Uncharacterized protein n=1 Tax=Colletotrichum sidae TaxID=1347389 RepID=A0A4R8TUK4_9PEZI|nr:hypothetical protein C8034_v003241 [Colletotrichum sidae]
MCDFEEFLFTCNHSIVKLKSHCHSARNDPIYQCFSVKVLRNSWRQSTPCDNCILAWSQPGQHFAPSYSREDCVGGQGRDEK